MASPRTSLALRSFFILTMLAALLIQPPAHASAATVVYVNAKAHGANNGTSWTDAYKSLSTALKKAPSGSQIWVAKGNYFPTVRTNPADPRSATFTLRNKVALYGGFKGTETLLKQRKPLVNVTTLSGDIGVAVTYTDNAYHVVSSGAVSNSAVLDGFQVTAGYANGPGSSGEGGGMLNDSGSPTLRNIRFVSNHATMGGGMFDYNGQALLTNIRFDGNSADTTTGKGGGLYNFSSQPTLTNVTFDTNVAHDGAGMINHSMYPITITNATFYHNVAAATGGGLFSYGGSTATLLNSTFNANAAGVQGGAIYNPTGTVYLNESILWGDGTEFVNAGTATATDSLIQGGCSIGPANCNNIINSDPFLVSLANRGSFVPTMALGVASPAIDAGGEHAACAPRDARGVKRPQGLACDLGAYEVNVANFRSIGLQDGQVTESTQTSSVGKGVNSAAATFKVGDTNTNQQVKGVLSFNTGGLPNSASVVSAQLFLTQQTAGGMTPWLTHGNLEVDVTKPFFGSSAALAAGDFQAGALVPTAAFMDSAPAGSVYQSDGFSDPGLSAINLLGATQMRLHWTSPDDNDFIADYAAFYSGDASSSVRPRLVIYYNP